MVCALMMRNLSALYTSTAWCKVQSMYYTLSKSLKDLARPQTAAVMSRFFKTGEGQYAEGDVFIGVSVPQTRALAKKYFNHVKDSDCQKLIMSKIHEERLLALELLKFRFKVASDKEKRHVQLFAIRFHHRMNNWDLIDGFVPTVLGDYLVVTKKSTWKKYLLSGDLWQRRISILATFPSVKRGEDVYIRECLMSCMNDQRDLVQKACGWMIRELGKRNNIAFYNILSSYAHCMPRTMLRYSIEHCSQDERRRYMNARVSI